MDRQYQLIVETAWDLLKALEEVAREDDPNVFTHENQVRMGNLRNVLEGKEPIVCPRCYNSRPCNLCERV